MTWINGRFKEDEQDNSVGWLSIDWEVDSGTENAKVVYTHRQHIDTKSTAVKTKFKANAVAERDLVLGKQTKQDGIGTTITTFMNK